MVSLHLYRFCFYFTVIWLIAGILIVGSFMMKYVLQKRTMKGDHKRQ